MPVIDGYTANARNSTFTATLTIENSAADGIDLPEGQAYWDLQSSVTVSAAIGIYVGGPLGAATNQSSDYVTGIGTAVFLLRLNFH